MVAGSEPPFVLVVEDDLSIAEALTAFLESEGIRVCCANNGQDALEFLSGPRRPCLILLDLSMPILNGEQFRLEQLRRPELAQIPVVVMSADRQVTEKATQIRADGFLRKPVDIDSVLDVVRKYCPA